MVRVRYLKGGKIGWERQYPEDIAMKLKAQGEVEILSPEEPKIVADMDITKGIKKDTLLKIAEIRGIKGAEKLTKAEIFELMESTEAKGEGNLDYAGGGIE